MIYSPGNPRPGRRTRVLLLPALAAVLASASGCSGGTTPTAAGSTSTGSPQRPAGSSGGSVPAAGSARTPSSGPGEGGTGTASPRPTAASSAPAPSVAGLPRAADPRQGRRYWAVLGAVSTDIEDPKLTAAEKQFRGLGYSPGRGELDCLQGARDALKVKGDSSYYEVDVLFATQKQAAQVAGRLGGKVAGIARVTAFCLD